MYLLSPAQGRLAALDATAQLTAEVRDQNGQVMAGIVVTWSSSEAGVAGVDAAGLVTAAGNGTATITVATGSVTGSATVVVEQDAVALSGLPAADTLLWYGEPGDTLRLVAEAADANGHPVEGARFGWSSSLASVATVDAGGLVRGAGEGVTTITATADSLRASTELTVINRDRAALAALYHATGGPNWQRNKNWLSPRMQDWEGVRTDLRNDGVVTVTSLLLHRNNLTGPIPPELGNLMRLVLLVLMDNQLTGPIPPELGNLAKLEGLWLDRNDISGLIPSWLGNLAQLRELSLRDNALIGPIPPELGNPARLEGLLLDRNALTGPIPSELGNLSRLLRLQLGDNQLSGSIPPEIGNLTELQSLILHNNPFSGALPQTLTNVPLSVFLWHTTGLCSPPNEIFQRWLQGISAQRGGGRCAS